MWGFLRQQSVYTTENSLLTSAKLATVHDWTLTVSRQVVRALVYRLALSEADLQEKLSQHFPIRKQKYLLTLTLFNPEVVLHELQNRIEIKVGLTINLPGGIKARGYIQTHGQLIYVQQEGAFYLASPDITALEIHPLPTTYLKPVRYMLRALLTRLYSENPVFRFRDNSIRHRMVRQVFKNVEIRRGKLRVNLHIR
jgi:hypothetical protein